MDSLFTDLRDAVRRARTRPAFTLVAVTILAAGIGAATVLFSIGYAVLLRPLPYDAPQQLVKLLPVRPGATGTAAFSEGEYIELDRRSSALTAIAAYYPSRSVAVSDDGLAIQVQATRATGNLFETLGARPIVGRAFDAEEESPSGPLAVILSHSFWLERFGGDPNVAGRSIVVDDLTHVVIGVAPENLRFPDTDTRLWLPLTLDRADVNYHSGQYLEVVGRIAAEVTREKAQDELRRISVQLTDEELTRYSGMRVRMVDLHEDLVGPTREPLLILIGVVALVLSAVCFNLGSFFLSYVIARRPELTLRAALGAGAGRLIRTVVTEVLLLSGVGALLGTLLASEAFRLLHVLRPTFIPRVEELGLDESSLCIATTTAMVAALLFGVGPAFLTHRIGSPAALRVRGPITEHLSSARARSILVAVQVAASVVLLVGGGLLLRSLLRLGRVDPGFDAEGVVTFRISLPTSSYPTNERVQAFYHETLNRIRALPGVQAAGATTILPMSGMRSYGFAWREEQIGNPNIVPQGFEMRWVVPGFFETLRIPLVAGRRFDRRDTVDDYPSAVLSRSLARSLWPSESAIGKRFKLGRLVDEGTPWITVVGVVGDVRHTNPQSPAVPAAYFAQGQLFTPRQMSIVARTTLPLRSAADAVRTEVLAIDRGRPVYAVRPMTELVQDSVSVLRFSTVFVVSFATLVVFITLVGLYGFLAYTARLRAPEFTIRMILGAPPGSVARSLLRESSVMCGMGITFGLVAALVLARFLESLLFGLAAWDPATFAGASALVTLTTLAASVAPARKATTLDPRRVLRE